MTSSDRNDRQDGRTLKCSIIGAGNVATHLALSLSRIMTVTDVFSRDISNARILADRVGSRAIDNLNHLSTDSDFYLISVVDDAIPWVIDNTKHIKSGLWAHTSGSTPMSIFANEKEQYGVFYPLQTFSMEKTIDMGTVPMLIEGSSEAACNQLRKIASSISRDVKQVDSLGRMRLHVAAVFACNFANFMWMQADDILHRSGMDIRVLSPLLHETLDKLNSLSPFDGQTGPARRGDFKIIGKHMSLLDGDRQEIYGYLSKKIYNTFHPDDTTISLSAEGLDPLRFRP